MTSPTTSPTQTSPSADLLKEIEATWPDLSFHYGFSYHDLYQMPRWLRDVYARGLRRLLAQQQLNAIEAASFAYLKDSARQATIRRLQRVVGRQESPQKPKDRRDMDELAAIHGIGVKRV